MDITDIKIEEEQIQEQEEESKEVVLKREIDAVISYMEKIEVASDTEFTTAGEWLKKNKDTQKIVKEKFGPELEDAKEKKRQAEAERKAVDKKIKQFTAPLEKAERVVKEKISFYQMEKERKRKEEEERRRKEEAERQKAAEESGEEIVPEPTQPVEQKEEEPAVEGVSFYETWTFEIEDPLQIPREYLVTNEKKIRQYVQAMKEDAQIPGVKIYKEKKTRVR